MPAKCVYVIIFDGIRQRKGMMHAEDVGDAIERINVNLKFFGEHVIGQRFDASELRNR